jgi:hypothetical protein
MCCSGDCGLALWSKKPSSEPPDDAQETKAEPDAESRDRRQPAARQARSEWFERQLDEQWEEVEPGIYRLLPAGPTSDTSADRPLARPSDLAEAQRELFSKLDELIDDLTRDLHPHDERGEE